MVTLFFGGWWPLVRVLVVGILGYAALICILRLTGKRTLSKLNAFDLVITVSLGSTMATTLLSKDISLSEGILAFATLCGLQFLVTWSCVRFPRITSIVKSEPTVLVLRGVPIRAALRRQRVTLDEVQAAVRQAQLADFKLAEAVILETDGSLSVITKAEHPISITQSIPDAALP